MFSNVTLDDYVSQIILTPINSKSLILNEELLQTLPWEILLYLSVDAIKEIRKEDIDNYISELWNSLEWPHLECCFIN